MSALAETASDLIVENARLMDGRVVAIVIEDGRYRSISSEAPESNAATRIDAGGRLVTESFVNGHMHLDKVYTLPLAGDGAIRAYTGDSMGEAMRSIVEGASAVKTALRPCLDHAQRSACARRGCAERRPACASVRRR